MEYKKAGKHWEECLNEGNEDEAVKLLECQIAMNLKEVHNRFSSVKLLNNIDVYAYVKYAMGVAPNDEEAFKPFVELNRDFIEAGYAIDDTNSKEYVLNEYQSIEKRLKEEMKKI